MSKRNKNKQLKRLLLVDDDGPSPKSRRSSQGSKGRGAGKSPARGSTAAGTSKSGKSAPRRASGGTQASPAPGTSRGRSQASPAPSTSRGGSQASPAPGKSRGRSQASPAPSTSRGGSQTQTSMSDFLKPGSSKKGKFNILVDDEVLELARSCASVILAGSNYRNKTPVSRQELIKTLLVNHDPRHYAQVIVKTSEVLQDIFGVKLISSDDRPLEKSDKILVVNTLTSKKFFLKTKSEEEIAHRTLLVLLLYCIHMAGGKLSEEALLDFITDLGIGPSDTDNVAFGSIPKKLNTYKTQSYLKYSRDKTTDPPSMVVEWGPRATAECCKDHMMSFIRRLYPELQMSDFNKLTITSDVEESGSESDEDNTEK